MKLYRVIFIGLIFHLTLCAKLLMPSDLVLKALSSSEVYIQWKDNADSETGYKIFRDGVLIKITSANVTSYVDKNLLPNHTYKYSVKATDDQNIFGKFILTAYNPPSGTEYSNSSFDDVWRYYKGAYLETVSRIDPANKGLFESAKKEGLKYYIDIRYIFFEDKLDKDGVDYLRGVKYLENGDTTENVEPDDIPQSTIDSIKELVSKYKDDPYLEGYWICDEPFPSGARNIAKVIDAIKEIDPKHPSVVNIARNEWTTKENLRNFFKTIFKTTGTGMFSFNFSIFWMDDKYKLEETTEAEQEKAYYKRFEQMQKLSLDLNISYGFIAQMVGTEYKDPENIRWRTPNSAEYRWEVYTALAYGVHSLSWFYWEYDDKEDPNSAWGVVDLPAEQRESIYNKIKSVNKEIYKLKDIMANLRSEEVYHMSDAIFEQKPIVAENSDSPLIVGLFKNIYDLSDDKKHYFMIVNKDRKKGLMEDYDIVIQQSRYPDAPKDNATVSLEYFNTITNRWEDIDVANNKFKAYLDAGQGKLFRFSF